MAIVEEKPWIYFISPSVKGGAQDTKTGAPAIEYRDALKQDSNWVKVPSRMTPVTGKLAQAGTSRAFVFDKLEWDTSSEALIDLDKFAQLDRQGEPTSKGITFGQGRTVNAAQFLPNAKIIKTTAKSSRTVWAKVRISGVVYLKPAVLETYGVKRKAKMVRKQTN